MSENVITVENLFSAWEEFKKGKQNKSDVMRFERNLEDNLFQLHEELNTKTYRHQPYHQFHVHDPKFRVVNKATVRDRVVHHLVFRLLEPIFQPTFIYHSYSCQTGKGIHQSVANVSGAIRKVSNNYTRTVWSLKLDIKKFFASVDQDILLRLLFKRVEGGDMRWLLEVIIRSFASDQGPGRGMPIGNLTSQIFANVYLSELDYFIKHQLKVRWYFRYADDFLMLHERRSYLEFLQEPIDVFVQEQLHLLVHPQKIVFRKLNQGIDWLGYVLRPHYRILRTNTKQRMFKKMQSKVAAFNQGQCGDYSLEQTLQSYLGLLSHCHGHRLEEQLCNEVWWWKEGK